jgi:4-hydroxybenzoate polyprenyltransferase
VAHVFVFNDWSGIRGDLADPNRAMRTFVKRSISRAEMGYLAIALLLSSLLLLGLLGPMTFLLGVAIASLSTLYSAPVFDMKGLPVFNSILHLVGGSLHFLLGYATFAAVDSRAIAMSCFFALVFTADHLMHEARDREADLRNGISTNSVAFGKVQGFVAGLGLFTAAYMLLSALAIFKIVPPVLFLTAVFCVLHLWASLLAVRAGLTYDSLSRLQKYYRLIFGCIGIMIVVAVRLT